MIDHLKEFYNSRSKLMREKEIARIFYHICMMPDISRKKLSQKLKIRPTTVSNHVQELMAKGLVLDGNRNVAESGRGRPELVLKPNYNRLLAITMYAENRTLMGALINFGGKCLVEQNISIPNTTTNEQFLQYCSSMISQMKQWVPDEESLVGVGISLSGTVNLIEKRWDSVARWPNIRNLDFSPLQDLAGDLLISRSLETELHYYLEQKPELKKKKVLLFHWGFGIGASYADKGHIFGYQTGHFGEIGHTRLSFANTQKCHCGKIGCLETEVALWALLPKIRVQIPEATESEKKLAEFLKNSDHAKIPAIREALCSIALAIGILSNILFPDNIVFIGPFTENKQIFNELIEHSVKNFLAYHPSQPKFDVIHGGFLGSRYASAYPLFSKSIINLLTSRSKPSK